MADGSGEVAPVGIGVTMYEYSDALAAEICRRVADGESVSSVARDPRMPSVGAVGRWASRHAGFKAELKAAMKQARLAERTSDLARALSPRKRPGGRRSTYTPAMGEAICARLSNGETLTSIGQDPAMPCFGTMLKWVKRHPEFAGMYVEARQDFADYMLDEARDLARTSTHATVWSDRLRFDVIR